MPTLETVKAYFAEQAAQTSTLGFLAKLLWTWFLCALLGRFYVAFGSASSNRRSFARVFVLLGLTTALVVTVIKTSLALSLGLVGALSIVRFRGAIKDPEELAYVFACIAVGLGIGADQPVVTTLSLASLLVASYVHHRFRVEGADARLLLMVSSTDEEQAGSKQFSEVLKQHCPQVNLRRLEITSELVEASYSLDGVDYAGIESAQTALRQLSPSVKVTVLDNAGVF